MRKSDLRVGDFVYLKPDKDGLVFKGFVKQINKNHFILNGYKTYFNQIACAEFNGDK